MWVLRIISKSNCWWTFGRCGHICRPFRFRLNVVNGDFMLSAYSTVDDNVVISVFHLKYEIRE